MRSDVAGLKLCDGRRMRRERETRAHRTRPVVVASIWMDEFLVVLAGGCEVEVEVGK